MPLDTETLTLGLLGRQLQRVLDNMNAFEKNIPLQLKSMDAKLELLNARLDQHDTKFKRIEDSLDVIANYLVQLSADVHTLLNQPPRSG